MNDTKPTEDSAFHDEDKLSLPSTPAVVLSNEQRAIDRSLNRKLDLILLPLLAFNFLLCGIDKTSELLKAFPPSTHSSDPPIPLAKALAPHRHRQCCYQWFVQHLVLAAGC